MKPSPDSVTGFPTRASRRSSALGAALATAGPAYLLTGELALLHDMGGLMAARQAGHPLTILCVNNGGGGIFDFLPLAEHADPQIFEEHIATPAGIDLAKVAAMLELPHSLATTSEEVRERRCCPTLSRSSPRTRA